MTLELERLAVHLPRIGEEAAATRVRSGQRLAQARAALVAASDIAAVDARVREARTSWLLASPLEPPATRHPRPEPRPYTIVAVDGSHHELDRFAATSCAIVNLGGWRIRYGDTPEAEPLAGLHVLTGDELAPEEEPGAGNDASAVDGMRGALLGALRQMHELRFLTEAANDALADPANHPVVGLLDGNLVLWSLTAATSAARRLILDEGILAALDELRQIANRAEFAFGGYISQPGATEVVNMLRLQPGACYRGSGEQVDCGRRDEGPQSNSGAGCEQRAPSGARPCDSVATTDRALFATVLEPGERSATFLSIATNKRSVQATAYEPRGHYPAFCYIAAGNGEIARIEFPRWLHEKPGALDLLHAAVLDQCERGWGYPIALQEAHERAVLTGEDRRVFESLVEREMDQRGVAPPGAGKQMSKRARSL